MKAFTLATAILALLIPALAAPSVVEIDTRAAEPVADVTPRAEINEADIFTFASPQASCKVLNCIDVVSQGICIANAIDDEDWKGILKCAKKKTLCGCAGCIKKLDKFLTKYGICDD
ncbi:uncharacterized protein CTHT_0049710 [Thermochaetoides thermophila DSM 1495]|uniref:Uncharacterized protein n=1 Tax=Chaetomium thermophilum (strain DSM 1495 / CBS 144.50 / IMI 039719) TaxID=759272 RepID=G0SBC2_CHATD|nr:hypothetical protein CTHT_0049710 [Thermochaetoides thermophila DSM 1495]EGS19502.1 hypothetical protein CTHT_0049710 [Thermochaetoides thermophila DSM 1495]